MSRLKLQPVSFAEAKAFVEANHRHHQPPQGHLFSIAANDGGRVVGVAIVGRPVARRLQDGLTCELTRMATDGTRNACSFLYGRAWRAAQQLGYQRMVTYTLPEEGGASLRAAGFKLLGTTPGRSWNVPSRRRVDKHPLQEKFRWEKRVGVMGSD